MEALYEDLEVVMSQKYQKVRLLGWIGMAGSSLLAKLVYPQPKDLEFDFVAVTPLPKETARKAKNRAHRQKRSARRIIIGSGDFKGTVRRNVRISKAP